MTAFRRAPRPLTGWLYLACGIGSLVVLILIMSPLLRALNRWADGEPVDWMGFAAVGGVAFPFIAQLIAQGAQWMHTRSAERREEIRVGGAPVTGPFYPTPSTPSPDSSPTPEGGIVNTGALDQQ